MITKRSLRALPFFLAPLVLPTPALATTVDLFQVPCTTCNARSIGVDGQGYVYAVSDANGQIIRLSPADGTMAFWTLPSSWSIVTDLAFDDRGGVYFGATIGGESRIAVVADLNTDSNLLLTYPLPSDSVVPAQFAAFRTPGLPASSLPSAVAIDTRGSTPLIYASFVVLFEDQFGNESTPAVVGINPATSSQTVWSSPDQVPLGFTGTSMLVDRRGRVWFSIGGTEGGATVSVLDPAAGLLDLAAGVDNFSGQASMALDGHGNVFVGERTGGLFSFDRNTLTSTSWSVPADVGSVAASGSEVFLELGVSQANQPSLGRFNESAVASTVGAPAPAWTTATVASSLNPPLVGELDSPSTSPVAPTSSSLVGVPLAGAPGVTTYVVPGVAGTVATSACGVWFNTTAAFGVPVFARLNVTAHDTIQGLVDQIGEFAAAGILAQPEAFLLGGLAEVGGALLEAKQSEVARLVFGAYNDVTKGLTASGTLTPAQGSTLRIPIQGILTGCM
jgi:streptogramin lyase